MKSKLLLTLLLLIGWVSSLMAQSYSIAVGSTEFLELTPPAGLVYSANWSCDEGLQLTKSSEVGAIVTVTHYFSGAAYVNCSYVYEYLGSYDHNYHASTGTKTYRITCVGGTATISATELELDPGQTYKLTYSRNKTYGTPVWSSSNEDVATVDKNGKVTAVATGVARIILDPITSEQLQCLVTVSKIAPTKISLTPNPLTVGVGKTKSLKPVYAPNGASATVTWTSANEQIATVSSSGVVKGIAEGKTTITAITDNGLKATAQVEVAGSPTAVHLPDNVQISVGYYHLLTPTLTPTNSEASYTWKSSDTSVASITSAGRVYGKKAGSVTITVTTDNKLSTTTTLTVVAAPDNVERAVADYRVNTITKIVNKIAE